MNKLLQIQQQAFQQFQTGNFSAAEVTCLNIIKQFPHQTETLHLLGLIYRQLNQPEKAYHFFTLCLKVNDKQSNVHLNFANFLIQINQIDQALLSYEKAHNLAPNNLDALYNWSLILNRKGQYEQAVITIKKAIELSNTQPQFYNVLGNALKNIEHYDDAITAFNAAIKLNPLDFFAWHNLGVTHRILGKPNEAINCYEKIKIAGESVAEYHFNLGCAFYDMNELNLAENSLEKAINLKPDYVMAHEALNTLYWEKSQKSKFLGTYNLYLKTNQQPTEAMIYSYSTQLIRSNNLPKAEEALNNGIKLFGKVPAFCHALATVYLRQNQQTNLAFDLLKTATNSTPNNVRYKIDLANILIKKEQYQQALIHLEQAISLAPNNQETWAYKGICWRLLKDERESWLNDYKQLISIQKISAPANYDNLEHFFATLKIFLRNLHVAKEQPLDQSVVGGSQTNGNLLLNSAPIIQELRTAINNNITSHLSTLTYDAEHPFLSRLTGNFNLSGCWSVLLNNKGYHTNHIHPDGWLSGPTYISVPDSIHEADPHKSGWVKFGETSLNLGDKEKIGLEHCPKEGECVFFPSFMWHGTNPTVTDEIRMTTPCDIQPI